VWTDIQKLAFLIKSEITRSRLLTLDLILISLYCENDLVVDNTTKLVVNLLPPDFQVVRVSISFQVKTCFGATRCNIPFHKVTFLKLFCVKLMYMWRAHNLLSFSLIFKRKMPKGRSNIFTLGEARWQVIVLELARSDKRKVHKESWTRWRANPLNQCFLFFQFCC
jgi:hypothetical protein